MLGVSVAETKLVISAPAPLFPLTLVPAPAPGLYWHLKNENWTYKVLKYKKDFLNGGKNLFLSSTLTTDSKYFFNDSIGSGVMEPEQK